jgi:hypothetical protein
VDGSQVSKPERVEEPEAPGRQLPKIIAASPMKPRPAIWFSR